jgi:hypothetical protein
MYAVFFFKKTDDSSSSLHSVNKFFLEKNRWFTAIITSLISLREIDWHFKSSWRPGVGQQANAHYGDCRCAVRACTVQRGRAAGRRTGSPGHKQDDGELLLWRCGAACRKKIDRDRLWAVGPPHLDDGSSLDSRAKRTAGLRRFQKRQPMMERPRNRSGSR